jgi:hypothetical protein
MNAERVFVDTNVLTYLFDHAEAKKQELARLTLERETREIFVSTQVLQELPPCTPTAERSSPKISTLGRSSKPCASKIHFADAAYLAKISAEMRAAQSAAPARLSSTRDCGPRAWPRKAGRRRVGSSLVDPRPPR